MTEGIEALKTDDTNKSEAQVGCFYMLLVYRVLVDAVLPNRGYMKNSSNHDGNHVAPRFTVLYKTKKSSAGFTLVEQNSEERRSSGLVPSATQTFSWRPHAETLRLRCWLLINCYFCF